MPARRVRLRPVYVTRFEHALEAHHGVLLVELRALRRWRDALHPATAVADDDERRLCAQL